MFLEHPQKPSDAVDKLVIQVIVDICDSIVEEHNLIVCLVHLRLCGREFVVNE